MGNPVWGRTRIADHIVRKLESEKDAMANAFAASSRVASCYVDELLPDELAREIASRFPSVDDMTLKDSLRERKYISAQMDKHDKIVEDTVFAFQDPRVIKIISEITGIDGLEADLDLYAGGISAMVNGHFLNPHLDNSHDKERRRYRVLNLLYYVSPNWTSEYGGNLELWDEGPKGKPRQIDSLFNRLVVMITDKSSWHSVNEVINDGARCCVSNYYFSARPAEQAHYFHATSYRGRPEERVRDMMLRADNAARTMLLKTVGRWFFKNPHVYVRRDNKS
jgi:Rps23 Pro-64 3,4-dihydroxylase Tpa1-like proline 4-hydroxylase